MAEIEPAAPVTVIEPETHWSDSLVGDNAERGEAMKAFETPDAYFAANDTALDWRRGVAGDDEKYYTDLQRFNTAQDYGNSFREAQQTIRSGTMKAELGPEPTDEALSAFRSENGIPSEAAGYLEDMPEGLVVGENDKDIMIDFMGSLHSKNADPSIAHAAIEWYNNFAEREQSALLDMDGEQAMESDDLLRQDWGPDYRSNLNLVEGFIGKTFGADAAENLLNGRYGDGRAFMNDPAVLKGLAEVARRVNPIMEMGGDHHTAQQSLNDEIGTIEKFMESNRTDYNKDEKMQARLRQLYQIRIDQAAA